MAIFIGEFFVVKNRQAYWQQKLLLLHLVFHIYIKHTTTWLLRRLIPLFSWYFLAPVSSCGHFKLSFQSSYPGKLNDCRMLPWCILCHWFRTLMEPLEVWKHSSTTSPPGPLPSLPTLKTHSRFLLYWPLFTQNIWTALPSCLSFYYAVINVLQTFFRRNTKPSTRRTQRRSKHC